MRAIRDSSYVDGVQQAVLIVTRFDETERAADGNLADDVEGVELHPGEEVEGLLRFREVCYRGHEFGVDLVDERFVHYEGSHRVQVRGLAALLGVGSVVSLSEQIWVCFIDAAERAVELGLAELGAGAVDGADGGWVADAIAVWG